MAHFAIDKTLTANDLRFHYRDWNGHGWPTLLIHGLASTSHIWDLVAPLLSETSRTVALDLRGHGHSDKPDCPYTFPEIGGDVLSALDALSFERPVLVGQGWGALVALWIAANASEERIAGLVMVDGGLVDLGISMNWQQALDKLAPQKLDGITADEFRQMIIERTPQEIITPAVEAALLANFEIDAGNRIHRRLPADYHWRIVREMWEMRLAGLYEKLALPVLILPARSPNEPADQLAAKEKAAAEADNLIDDLEVIWLDAPPDDVPLHRPHRIAEEVRRFVKDRL